MFGQQRWQTETTEDFTWEEGKLPLEVRSDVGSTEGAAVQLHDLICTEKENANVSNVVTGGPELISHICVTVLGIVLNVQIRRRCPRATSSQWLLGLVYDLAWCCIMVKTRNCSIFPFGFKSRGKTEVKTRKEVGARRLRGLMNNAAKAKSLPTINSVLTDLY